MSRFRSKTIRIMGAAVTGWACLLAVAQGEPPGYVQIVPDQIEWSQSPSIPSGGQVATVYGDPRKPAPYITRVRLPADYRIQPHAHPEERVYTVISGIFYIGFGEQFEPTRLKAFPAGAAFVVPANASHFHWMRSGEAVVQISGVGPSGIEYVDHADDPRQAERHPAASGQTNPPAKADPKG